MTCLDRVRQQNPAEAHWHPKLVLFDLDGTLVDSLPDIAWCIDGMLKELGHAAAGAAQVQNWVGNGAELLVRRALTRALHGDPDEDLFGRAYAVFNALYAAHGDERSRLYDGVRTGLNHVRGLGIPMGCVTNKPERFTHPLLRSLGIAEYFALVVGGDSLARKKPDPLPLQHCAELLGLKAKQCLMIGDSINDIAAARAAGMPVMAVTYGYNHGEDIATQCPDIVLRSLAELVMYLAN